MKILIACECYGVVRDAFIRNGHDAWSCDLKDTRVPGPHIKADVLTVLNDGWDLMIAHPDCDFLSNCGVQWLDKKPGRWEEMKLAVKFFKKLKRAKIKKICLENPVPHKYGIGKTYTQIIQPYHHGHRETKKTCLWLKGLPKLVKTKFMKPPYEQRIWKMSPGPMRKEWRAVFYPGIAWAMADQWGQL